MLTFRGRQRSKVDIERLVRTLFNNLTDCGLMYIKNTLRFLSSSGNILYILLKFIQYKLYYTIL